VSHATRYYPAQPAPPKPSNSSWHSNFRRQIRQGIATNTKGSAYVVYEDVNDAKSACDRLNGFNFQSRYLVVLYHQPEKMSKANAAAAASSSQDLANRAEHLEKLKQQHGVA
jgi:pre-mRNA branch site protein p14